MPVGQSNVRSTFAPGRACRGHGHFATAATVALALAIGLVACGPASAQYIQEGNKLVGTGYVGNNVQQGISVALSADGNTLAVGGFEDNDAVGAVWVFTRSGGVWTQQGSKLVGTGAVGGANQGISVALSADGNTLIEGGYSDNYFTGAAWVFTRSSGVWTQQGSKLVWGVVPSQARTQIRASR